MLYRTVLTITFLLCLATSGAVGLMTFQAMEDASLMYQNEGECIAKHIALGIERKDIRAKHGTCWVVGNYDGMY